MGFTPQGMGLRLQTMFMDAEGGRTNSYSKKINGTEGRRIDLV